MRKRFKGAVSLVIALLCMVNVHAFAADLTLDAAKAVHPPVSVTGSRGFAPQKNLDLRGTDNKIPSGYTGISGVKDYALVKGEGGASGSQFKSSGVFKIDSNGRYTAYVRDNVDWISDPLPIQVNTIDRDNPSVSSITLARADNKQVVTPGTWVNTDVIVTAKGTDATSGIDFWTLDKSRMSNVNGTSKSVIDIDGKPFNYTHNHTGTFTVDYKNNVKVFATDMAGNKSTVSSVDIRVDKLAPNGKIVPSHTDWTNQPITLTFTATDAASDGKSGVSGIKRVKFDGSTSGKTPAQGWVNGDKLAITIKESSTFTFIAEDNAGNQKKFTTSINFFDDVKPQGWITGNDGKWTNKDITLTLHGKDVDPPSPPSGVVELVTPKGSVKTDAKGTQEVTTPHVVGVNGTYDYAVKDRAGNVYEFQYEVKNIDKVPPTVEWTEDVRYDLGKSTIYIVADDDISGVDYIECPDGTKIYADKPWKPGDKNPLGYAKYEVTQNGIYTFKIYDRAGNFIVKTFTYEDLRHDYYAKDITFIDNPIPSGDFEVQVTWGNRVGVGSNIPVELYYIDGKGNHYTLAQDTITVSQGNELVWSTKINFANNTEVTRIYAVIDPMHLAIDLTKDDNTAVKDLKLQPFNYAVTSDYATKFSEKLGVFAAPGEVIEIPVIVSGTNLGQMEYVPLEMYLDNNRLTRTYVYIGEYNTPVYTSVQGYIPKNISGPHTLDIRVNWDKRADEATEVDNKWAPKKFTVQAPDLRLKFNETVVNSGDVYSYPSNADKYKVVISAFNPNEVLKSVTTLGKTVEPNVNSQEFTLDLEMQQKQTFHVVVESACKKFTKDYDITVVRLNDDMRADIWVTLPDGSKYVAEDDGTGNYVVHLPVTSTTGTFTVDMIDDKANVVIVDSNQVNKNRYDEEITLPAGSSVDKKVRVSAEDPTIQKEFTVTITNKNVKPSIKITNKQDINGVMFGLGGILKNNKFVKYGNDITSLEIAQRAGRTNGVAIEVEVKDPNPGQFLRGYVQLPGSEMKYFVRWGSFDGPTVAETKDNMLGYVYIDRTAMRADMNFSDVVLNVSDYASDSEAESALSTANDKVRFAIDITAPDISVLPDDTAGTVQVEIKDTLSGFSKAFYRISTDNGRTWSPEKPQNPETSNVNKIGASASIDLTGKYGNILVEVTAYDNILNKNSVVAHLKVKSPSVVSDAEIFASTNRVSNVVFINTRKTNADSISKQSLDTFK